ncbi:MAG: S49 family peptidase [Thiohalomonadaceae bacterium]
MSENHSPERVTASSEHDILSRLAFATLNEQRRSRRWSIFFKSLGFLYLFLLLFMFMGDFEEGEPKGRHTALVELEGVIDGVAGVSADQVNSSLRAAFENSDVAGIILRINSPGGSPVQSGEIFDEIRRLRQEYPDTPLYAVVGDICASGGYYVAAAADAIYVNKASIVGSIGVLMNGFGFVETLDKLGVERRLYTAGENKGFLDPFSPEQPQQVQHIRTLLDNVHRQFIDAVKQGRGERLKDEKAIFSGLVWTGEEGIGLGLVDGLGSADYVAREVIGAERIVDYTAQPDYLERFFERFGATTMKLLTEQATPRLR